MTKFLFDRIISFITLLILIPFILILIVISSIETHSFGLFTQKRVGQYGRIFNIFKIKTIHPKSGHISKWNSFLRKSKLDELPQLFNILIGEMRFVGPRPDIPGYYDKLDPSQQEVLNLKPGLTCEASLKYADEELLLANQNDPLDFNDHVIFPDKVRMNLEYYHKRNFFLDLKIIFRTLLYNSKPK